jgi:hypothetical protein
LTTTFIDTVLHDFNESLHSCSPQNQALVWLASGDGATTPGRMRQRYIFAFLFGLWDGPSWSVMDKWLSSVDECDWFGLSCNSVGEVTNITLSNNNARVDLPPIAALLTPLESLTLDYSTLQGNTIPTEVGLLSNLITLSLDTTGIKGTLPAELFNLGSTLQIIDFAQNGLSGTIPTLIGKLTNLRKCQQRRNFFFTPIRLRGMSYGATSLALSSILLEYLYIQKSKFFTGSIPAELGLCTNLVEVALSGIGLTGTLPTSLGSLSTLGKAIFC